MSRLPPVVLHPEVELALSQGRAVVALETTVLAHGLGWPESLDIGREMTAAIANEGATPAYVGIVGGRIRIGLETMEVERFARGTEIEKVSRGDLPIVLAAGRDGATTVSGTIACAALAGIRVMATGGIGGVHRGAERSFDVSADLIELARSAVGVVCSGGKSILDLPKTLEVLETQGVPVAGYRTDRLPAFYLLDAGLPVSTRVDTPDEAARLIEAAHDLGTGVVVANPIPAADALDSAELDQWTDQAHQAAADAGVTGRDLTPFILARIRALSAGRSLAANRSLLVANARLGALIAGAIAGRSAALSG